MFSIEKQLLGEIHQFGYALLFQQSLSWCITFLVVHFTNNHFINSSWIIVINFSTQNTYKLTVGKMIVEKVNVSLFLKNTISSQQIYYIRNTTPLSNRICISRRNFLNWGTLLAITNLNLTHNIFKRRNKKIFTRNFG